MSGQLTAEYGRGLSRRNVFHMIRLAEVYPDRQIVLTLSAQLGWSHFLEIIALSDPLKRDFYAEMCRLERWSVRALRDRIRRTFLQAKTLARKPAEVAKQELEALREEDRLMPEIVFHDFRQLRYRSMTNRQSRGWSSAGMSLMQALLLDNERLAAPYSLTPAALRNVYYMN